MKKWIILLLCVFTALTFVVSAFGVTADSMMTGPPTTALLGANIDQGLDQIQIASKDGADGTMETTFFSSLQTARGEPKIKGATLAEVTPIYICPSPMASHRSLMVAQYPII